MSDDHPLFEVTLHLSIQDMYWMMGKLELELL